MSYEIGPQNSEDHPFKAKVRLQQSHFRAEVLNLPFRGSGNRLTDEDAENFANYYDGLEVAEQLRLRFRTYSQKRDADMLRSEHLAFNFFAPLLTNKPLATRIINKAFGMRCREVTAIKFFYAPEPNGKYLNDTTNYDVFIQYLDGNYNLCGIAIDMKFTENSFTMGKSDIKRTVDEDSIYWRTTKKMGVFHEDSMEELSGGQFRQLWRAHLLGGSMTAKKDIYTLTHITLHPQENVHFTPLVSEYNTLFDGGRVTIKDALFEDFIAAIDGSDDFEQWKAYLASRYTITADENSDTAEKDV